MPPQNSGSDEVSFEEAMAMLALSPNGLRGWMRKGILQARYDKRKPVFALRDVAPLTEFRSTKADIATGIRMAQQALAISRRVADDIRELRALAGLDRRPLEVTREAALELVSQAEDALTEEGALSVRELRQWAERFFDLDEAYLGWIESVTCTEEPWKVFLDLSARLAARAQTSLVDRGVTVEKRVQARVHFTLARDHLRRVAYFYCRQKHGIRIARRAVGESLAEHMLRIAEHADQGPKRRRKRRPPRAQP